MTSANTIEYTIRRDDCIAGWHRQNIMCSRNNDRLYQYKPASEYTIEAWGYDENEEEWESDNAVNLEVWLKANPAEFTFHKFEPGERVKLRKRGMKGEGDVIERFNGKWPGCETYTLKLDNGELLEGVNQNEVLQII